MMASALVAGASAAPTWRRQERGLLCPPASPEGTLRVIDLPPVFNPNDAAWTVEGTVYGVVIPEGKSSGWLVPDAYRDRF